MTVGFFHVATDTAASEFGYECARALVRSVRRTMASVQIVHFTDTESPGVKGVDAVLRKPSEPMALLRMRHHAGVQGDWLFVDTDVIFQKGVRLVFERAFDIGITTRNWTHVKPAGGFTARMPFNTGVVFSRSPRFWAEVYGRLRQLDAPLQQWMGDQEVICDLIAENEETQRYHVEKLKGSRYNYPPMLDEDKPDYETLEAEAAILHYKGARRKPLLVRRMKQEARCA